MRFSRREFAIAAAAVASLGAGIGLGPYWWRTRRLPIRTGLMAPPANLLRNAAFAQVTNSPVPDFWGLPTAAQVRSDRPVIGSEPESPIRDAPSIRFHNPSAEHEILFASAATFVPEAVPYTFSVYLRSAGSRVPVRLALGWAPPRTFMIDGTWRRYAVSELPAAEARVRAAVTTRIHVPGPADVWIAAPQLEKGEQASSFDTAVMDDHPLPEVAWPQPPDVLVATALRHPPKPNDSSTTLSESSNRDVSHAFITIDRERRTLRSGAESILVYGVALQPPATDWQFDDIVRHGFDTVALILPCNRGSDRIAESSIGAARDKGLRVIPILQHSRDERLDLEREHVLGFVSRWKRDPSILAWLYLDEPGPEIASGDLRRLYADVKAADPSRPAFINFNRWIEPGAGHDALDATDVGSFDAYLAGQYSNFVSAIADAAFRVNGDSAKASKPAASWLQIYGYDEAVREPTPDEAQASTYLAFITGSRLLLHWIYKPVNPLLWERIRTVREELKRLENIVFDSRARQIGKGRVAGRVYYDVWQANGRLHLFACNAAPYQVQAGIPVEQLVGARVRIESAWYGGASKTSRSLDRVAFAPYERQVFQLG